MFSTFNQLVAMAKFLDTSEKEVQLDHQHPKHFYTVKSLRKWVQYILRYTAEYANFCRVVLKVYKNWLCYIA